MKETRCEVCGKNTANAHFKHVCDGEVKELHICEECAAAKGLSLASPLSLADFLFGDGAQGEHAPAADDKSCSICHARWSDFKKTSRLGCWFCYQAFAEELKPVLASMHKGDRHVGKAPQSEAASEETVALRKALEDAIAKQDFEQAARLRDHIRELKEEIASHGKSKAV